MSTERGLPRMPPADGGPWRWDDPKGRGTVVVPGHPACIYDLADPRGLYDRDTPPDRAQPCGQPGRRYPCGYRCPAHAPAA